MIAGPFLLALQRGNRIDQNDDFVNARHRRHRLDGHLKAILVKAILGVRQNS